MQPEIHTLELQCVAFISHMFRVHRKLKYTKVQTPAILLLITNSPNTLNSHKAHANCLSCLLWRQESISNISFASPVPQSGNIFVDDKTNRCQYCWVLKLFGSLPAVSQWIYCMSIGLSMFLCPFEGWDKPVEIHT